MRAKLIFPLLLATICSGHRLYAADNKPINSNLKLETKEETFSDLVRELIDLGEKADHKNDPYIGKLAELVGLKEGSYGRGGGVSKDQSTDFLNHSVAAILDLSSKEPKVIAVMFMTDIIIEKVGNEVFHFRISPSGKLEKVVRIAGPFDGANKPIPGAGKAAVLDLNDPDVQYRFQHEMDFWLKNLYRRKKNASN